MSITKPKHLINYFFCSHIKDMTIIFLLWRLFRCKRPYFYAKTIVYLTIPQTAKYFPKYSEPPMNEKMDPEIFTIFYSLQFFDFHISNPWLVTLKIPILYKATHTILKTHVARLKYSDVLTHRFLVHSCSSLLITLFTISLVKCSVCVYWTFYLL